MCETRGWKGSPLCPQGPARTPTSWTGCALTAPTLRVLEFGVALALPQTLSRLQALEELRARGVVGCLPASLGRQASLRVLVLFSTDPSITTLLDLSGLVSLKVVRLELWGLTSLEPLHALPSLEELHVQGMHVGERDLQGGWPLLKRLLLENIPGQSTLGRTLYAFPDLEELTIIYCLTSAPDGLEQLARLKRLEFTIRTDLPWSVRGLDELKYLRMRGLNLLPHDLTSLHTLVDLHVSSNLRALPDDLGACPPSPGWSSSIVISWAPSRPAPPPGVPARAAHTVVPADYPPGRLRGAAGPPETVPHRPNVYGVFPCELHRPAKLADPAPR